MYKHYKLISFVFIFFEALGDFLKFNANLIIDVRRLFEKYFQFVDRVKQSLCI